MAENPLLPNAELRALRNLTRRCIALDAKGARTRKAGGARNALPGREALLAGTALQLKPGDLIIPERDDATVAELAPADPHLAEGSTDILPAVSRQAPRLMLAAAMAAALRAAGTDRVVVVYLRERATEPDWDAALAWAQQRQLPMILVCADPRGPNAFQADTRAAKTAFTWSSVNTTAHRLQLPVLTLDGEDAVAVYRAMQESLLRARGGGGPAILWGMLTPAAEHAAGAWSGQPLRRLEQYMRARRIPLT